jgi:hypothetical protein
MQMEREELNKSRRKNKMNQRKKELQENKK